MEESAERNIKIAVAHSSHVPTTAYRRGYEFERRVARYYEQQGCHVCRSSGSHGPFDLTVVCRGVPIGVQCKTDGRLSPAEEERMRERARAAEMEAVLVYRVDHELAFRKIR
jgi:Holliday junction resolvase